MAKRLSGSSLGKSDDATDDMVAQVAARVLAAMREETDAQDTADEVQQQTQGRTKEVAEQAQQKASGVVETVRQQATSRLDRQKDHAVEELTSVAGTVRQVGEQLKQPEHGAVAQYAAQYGDMAADQLQHISSYLREHNVKQLVREVENFARREPILFTGSAFLLGLMGARFLKSQPVSETEEKALLSNNVPPRNAAPRNASPAPDVQFSDETSSTIYVADFDDDDDGVDSEDDVDSDDELILGRNMVEDPLTDEDMADPVINS